MNALFDAERTRRWLGIAGAAVTIAIPIAFIAATWKPLEPAPRADRSALVEEAASLAQQHGNDAHRELVDQVCPQERGRELAAPEQEAVTAGVPLMPSTRQHVVGELHTPVVVASYGREVATMTGSPIRT